MYTILLVEDERPLRELISDYLTVKSARQWQVLPAPDGAEALLLAASQPIDLAILDVMLPDTDGFTVCRELRKRRDVPILFLSARTSEEDRLRGYGLGADDYMTKPFSQAELFAKAGALLRRSKGLTGKQVLVSGGVSLDVLAHTASVDGQPVDLAPKELAMLRLLLEAKGQVLAPGGPAAAAVGLGLRGQRPGGGRPRQEAAAGSRSPGPPHQDRIQNRVQMGALGGRPGRAGVTGPAARQRDKHQKGEMIWT